MTDRDRGAELKLLLRQLKLPGFAQHHLMMAVRAEREGWSFGHYLYQLAEVEVEERRSRRIRRHQQASKLPPDKTLATLEPERLTPKVRRQLAALCEGGFVEEGANVLAFGLPGRGKTHLVCAVGHELLLRGHTVLFTATFRLVQRLLAAKRQLRLEQELRQLDRFDVLILDDLGYVQQDRDEMEVLFTLLAERYERKSVMITSNLVFSQWDRIFKDPMTTAAAIDRVVHHATILELSGPSFRGEVAQQRQDQEAAADHDHPPSGQRLKAAEQEVADVSR